jgi:hypothetical protein
MRIYGNEFVDIANYPIFLKPLYGDFVHVRIFNNLLRLTSSAIRATNPPQGIALGVGSDEVLNPEYLGRWPVWEDVVVANNTIVDYGSHAAINFRNTDPTIQHAVFAAGNVCKNNLAINSGGINCDAAVDVAANLRVDSAAAASAFVSYADLSPANDLHPTAGASTIIGQGTDLSEYFTTDRDDSLRSAPWDIGAFISGEPPTAVAPTFTLHPQNEAATLGAVVLLSVTVSGAPTPALQWQKDGMDIAGATGATLVLAGVTLGDAGTYTCVATNSEGSATSDAAILTVNTPAIGIYRFAGLGLNPMLLLP